MKKKIFFSTLIFSAAFMSAGILKINFANALLLPATGWDWGGSEDANLPGSAGVIDGNETGIGWVSFDPNNPGAGGGSYGVNIPTEDGAVTGYAWSSNLQSYIDFAPHLGCPTEKYAGQCDAYPDGGLTKSDVTRKGNQLVGWARIVGIAMAKAANNSGDPDEDGWISLDPGSESFVVTIAEDGKTNGVGWAGKTLGGMSFESVEVATAPRVTLDVLPYAYLEPGQTFALNPKTTSITWTIADKDIKTCTRSCSDGTNTLNCTGWTGNDSIVNGNADVSVPASKVIYTLECKDVYDLITTKTAEVNYGCSVGVCETNTLKCKAHSGTFFAVTSGDDASCKGGCESDSDCVLRQGSNWREVAP
ncbi:MAG: hypothetical protein US63_C0031G0005 [Candidatus Moranbacteria bacterium GW2011_GWC2_37_8]|nr:MAG: hypothetical protein US63_C0031G0005 [Candidatus Moranbacteria bacterium GW2011_GWC2_37_8]KKQ61613.1 MAG: hypothetical protein US82_C0020G0008 [Parcubacteria group bacterium GW2011_GWC1_38_22]KKQ80889.1 MAG: hypothetical protein UT03_C0017G0004 [Candidatus Moranbacteria bacterium GW2011_GWD2_38_7]